MIQSPNTLIPATQALSQLGFTPTSGDESKETLTIVDNRTGKQYVIKITKNTINGADLFAIKNSTGSGIRCFDPGFSNTVSARSSITYIDGGKGILRYRGYPIEQLAEKSSFLDVAFLLLYGELPTANQLDYFTKRVMNHTFIHEKVKDLIRTFNNEAHPMSILISAVSALSTHHPEANPAIAGQDCYNDPILRNKQVHRAIGTISTISAFTFRHRAGRPFIEPSNSRNYAENFLFMLDNFAHQQYTPHPVLTRALDVLFILHADHELNCSTAAMRHLASSGVDVYSCLSGSIAALYGPKHGGANEAVVRMLSEIGSVENIPAFIQAVKAKKRKLMGFGHRVYKNYDPRAKIIKRVSDDVFSVLGKEPLIEIAVELERIALSDQYFIERKLYPNVDFYSGLIYKAMGFPTDFFTVLFTIPRTVGWLAHWLEFLDDKDNKIVRPYQMYVGSPERPYIEMDQRKPTNSSSDNVISPFTHKPVPIKSNYSTESRRRQVSNNFIQSSL